MNFIHIHVKIGVVRRQLGHVHERRVVYSHLSKFERLDLSVQTIVVRLIEREEVQAVLNGKAEHFVQRAVIQPKLKRNVRLQLHGAVIFVNAQVLDMFQVDFDVNRLFGTKLGDEASFIWDLFLNHRLLDQLLNFLLNLSLDLFGGIFRLISGS